jgi:hypothetical protein
VTAEIWVTLDRDNDPNSTLFSFGPPGHSISLKANFSGQEVYIAAVFRSDPFDESLSYVKVYLNGDLYESASIASGGLVGGLGLFDGCDFIGRDAEGNGPPMKGSVDMFTLWWGELSSSTLFTRYINATVPSALTLSEQVTLTDVEVVFYAQSTINIDIELVSGSSRLTLFDSVPFLIQAVGCDYNLTVVSGRAEERLRLSLPALNYTVTILPFTVPLPLYTPAACYLPGERCVCGAPVQPYDYLLARKSLSQSISIASLSSENVSISFTYHSELCMDVLNADSFPDTRGDLYIYELQSCFTKNTTFMKPHENYPIEIIVYERYPCNISNIEWKYLTLDCAKHSFDVLNVTLSIVSDWQEEESFAYIPASTASAPGAHSYSINPLTTPQTFPSTYNFAIHAIDQTNVEIRLTRRWVIPMTGLLVGREQTVIPVVSDPNLIFFVLRDPPGGTSTTTLKSGNFQFLQMISAQLP